MTLRPLLVVLLPAVVSACDTLSLDPGADFAVTWPETSELVVEGQTGSVELPVRVAGCRGFEVSLEIANARERNVRRLEANIGPDGVTRAQLPIEYLVSLASQSRCDAETFETGHIQTIAMHVRCLDDGRERSSDTRPIRYRIAQQSLRPSGLNTPTIASAHGDGGMFLVGTNDVAVLRETPQGVSLGERLGTRPSSDRALATLGNLLGVYSGTRFTRFELTSDSEGSPGYARLADVPLPGLPMDLVLAFSGDRTPYLLNTYGSELRVIGAEGPTTVQLSTGGLVVADEPFVRVGDGTLRVVVAEPKTAVVRRLWTDGTVEREQAVPGNGRLERVSLSPAGDRWLALRSGRIFMGDWERVTELTTRLAIGASAHHVRIAWSTRGPVLARDEVVQAYAIGTDGTAALELELTARSRVTGLSMSHGALALTTLDGVEVYSWTGILLGGASPLPCSLVPNSPARFTRNGRVVFPAGEYLFVLPPHALDVAATSKPQPPQ